MNWNLRVLSLGLLGLLSVGCKKSGDPILPAPTSFEISPSELTMDVGKPVHLTVTSNPEGSLLPALSWTTSDPDVLYVKDGFVFPFSDRVESVSVEARAGEIAASCRIKINRRDPEKEAEDKSLRFITPRLVFEIGETLRTGLIFPDPNPNVRFSVEDPAIAEVNAAGEVTAKLTGRTILTAKTGNETAYCLIDVIPDKYKLAEVLILSGGTYIRPVIQMGLAREDVIKANEKVGFRIIPESTTENFVAFQTGAMLQTQVAYLFKDGKLTRSISNIKTAELIQSEDFNVLMEAVGFKHIAKEDKFDGKLKFFVNERWNIVVRADASTAKKRIEYLSYNGKFPE